MADLFKDILGTLDNKNFNYFDENPSEEELKSYVPFLVNKNYSFGMDTLLYANEINKYHELNNKMQYDFYYYGIDKKKRFNFKYWKLKADKTKEKYLDYISLLYGCSKTKAEQYVEFYDEQELENIKKATELYVNND